MKPPMKKPTGATKAREAPKKTPAAAPMPGASHMGDEMHHRARGAMHTLKEAHMIRQDPELMEHVKRHAMEEKNALSKIIRRKT